MLGENVCMACVSDCNRSLMRKSTVILGKSFSVDQRGGQEWHRKSMIKKRAKKERKKMQKLRRRGKEKKINNKRQTVGGAVRLGSIPDLLQSIIHWLIILITWSLTRSLLCVCEKKKKTAYGSWLTPCLTEIAINFVIGPHTQIFPWAGLSGPTVKTMSGFDKHHQNKIVCLLNILVLMGCLPWWRS